MFSNSHVSMCYSILFLLNMCKIDIFYIENFWYANMSSNITSIVKLWSMFAHVATVPVVRPFHFPIPANKDLDFAVTNKLLLINIATIIDFNYVSISVVT